MKKVGSWLWGGVLIALGVIFGLNALGVTEIDIFFPGWWTLFIIVPCFINLFTDEHKFGNLIGLLIGICLLLGCLGVIQFEMVWKLFFPVLLILIGLAVIFHNTAKGAAIKRIRELRKERSEDGKEFEEYWATFGEQDLQFNGKEFSGCRLDSVFGGIDLDLRGAKMKGDVVVQASAIFGGVTIYVPEDVEVEVVSTAIFGGVSDDRKNVKRKAKVSDNRETKKMNNSGKTLYIDATCVFGGVEIR